MDHEPLKSKDNQFIGNSHIVRFDDVRFAYQEQEVLHGVSLELGEGTLTALFGKSGSGKSTLAKLLVHYYDLNGGHITLGGQDITDMSIEALNDNISYIRSAVIYIVVLGFSVFCEGNVIPNISGFHAHRKAA